MHKPDLPPVLRSCRMSDGVEVAVRVWPSAPAQRGVGVLYFHGIQSHGGWFERSASILSAAGVPVLLPDRRGSGLNARDRGDTPSVERWLLDIDELAAWAMKEYDITCFGLVGVSWGGKLAAAWALRKPRRVSRMLLITPGIFPAVDVSRMRRVQIAASLTVGGRARFEIPLSDAALFTDNPAGRAFIEADPLKLTHATARFLYRSTRLDAQLKRTADGALAIPTTLLLAEHDRIIRNEPTRAWLERISAAPPRVRELPSAHTLEFSESPDAFFSEAAMWRDALLEVTPAD